MPPPATDPNLHLDSLQISGFRGIPDLAIPRLGRVTLLAGKNGVGKTAVLNAVQMYAARCSLWVIATLLRNHREMYPITDDDGVEILAYNWHSLFYGRDMWQEPGIRIGPYDAYRQMTVTATRLNPTEPEFFSNAVLGLAITYGDQRWDIAIDDYFLNTRRSARPLLRQQSAPEQNREIGCELLGPGLPDARSLARFWDGAVIRDEQSIAVDALNLMLNAPAEWVAVVGDTVYREPDQGRRVIVKMAGEKTPVPLQSLGDGATRLLGVALAIANCRNGYLLIDEAENGIHHSIQQNFWHLVLQTAEKYNVQVLATTHSWDCVVGFAKAMRNRDDAAGVYLRLEKDAYGMRAVEYSRENLMAAAKYGIETR